MDDITRSWAAPARWPGQLPKISPKTEDEHVLFEWSESLA